MAIKKLSKGQLAGVIIAAILVVVIAAGGVFCIATKQNPVDAVSSVFSSNEDKLIGKWQSQSSPGLSAYVFYDDGTYDSYLSTVNFSGNYVVKGSKLTLINPETNKEVHYKYKVSGKVLTLTLLNQDGTSDEDDISKYDSVDELDQKTLSDLIGELAEDKNSENKE